MRASYQKQLKLPPHEKLQISAVSLLIATSLIVNKSISVLESLPVQFFPGRQNILSGSHSGVPHRLASQIPLLASL